MYRKHHANGEIGLFILIIHMHASGKHEALAQCRIDIGPPSTTLANTKPTFC